MSPKHARPSILAAVAACGVLVAPPAALAAERAATAPRAAAAAIAPAAPAPAAAGRGAVAPGASAAAAPASGAVAATPRAVASRGAARARCARIPRTLRLRRVAGRPAAILTWRAPRGLRGRLTYQVVRNGRVVGRVRARRMRVAVRPGARYRFTVAVVRGGRVAKAACRGSLRATVAVRAPSVPRGLAAGVASDRAVLSWSPSTPGDGRLAGYRVARDGRTFRQLRSTQATVPLASGRTYRLSVRAVDTRGHASAPAAIEVSTRREGPAAPTRLRADVTSGTDVRLAWDPADAGAGHITGYRVLRDGVILGQVRGPEMAVPRLRSAQAYTFTVVAVNSFGALSPPSRALTVSTDAPPASTGRLHAFLLASTGSSFASLRANYQAIGTLYPTYFECDRATGAIEGRDDPQVTQFARLRQVEVLPRFDCQHGPAVHALLTDPAVRQRTLDGLVGLVTANGYDGLNLDLESGPAADRDAMSAFVADLAGRLHAAGRKLTVDVRAKFRDDPAHSSSGMYDYRALAASADTVFVMAWGIHWSTSTPGALAEWPWLTKVVDYVASLGSPERYTFGVPMYGIDWAGAGGTASPGVPYEHEDVVALAARVGATAGWDDAGHEAHFAYTDAAGVGHRVWHLDARAVAERVALFRSRGFQAGLWRLGREDQGLWSTPGIGG